MISLNSHLLSPISVCSLLESQKLALGSREKPKISFVGAILYGKWGNMRVSKNKFYLPYQFSCPLYLFSHNILRLFSFIQQMYILLPDPSFKFVKIKVNKYIWVYNLRGKYGYLLHHVSP